MIFCAENASYVRRNKVNIQIIFYRTLSSQSAASLTCGYLATSLRKLGYEVKLTLLNPYSNNLKKIDLSLFNTNNVTDMSYMFSYCQDRKSVV